MNALLTMFTPKFITDENLDAGCIGKTIVLDSAESKHAGVLRVKTGDNVRVYSLPANSWFEGVILENGKQSFFIELSSLLNIPYSNFSKVQLLIGTPSTATLESIVQHTTEIGVASLVLFRAERTQFKLDEPAQQKVTQRLQKIAIAALKQSGASKLPQIKFDKRSLTELTKTLKPERTFLGSLESTKSLAAILLKKPRFFNQFEQNHETDDLISVVIGPEGGLTATEERALLDWGITPFSLGPTALRVETACFVTTGILNSFIQADIQRDEVP